MRHYLNRKQTPPILGALLATLTWLCPILGETCPLSPIFWPARNEYAESSDCFPIAGGLGSCAAFCKGNEPCKLFYLSSCTSEGYCTCYVCNQLTAIDFGNVQSHYYLKNRVIATNTKTVDFPGGLIAGQPLIFTITLQDTFVSLNFMSGGKNVAFMTEIRFNEYSVVSNSFLGYWGAEDRSTPHFNFYQNQHVSVFCVVTATGYLLYFDQVLFKNFPHRVPIDQVTSFTLGRTYSTILSFSR